MKHINVRKHIDFDGVTKEQLRTGAAMGVIESIGFDRFPKQGLFFMREVNVYFNYDTSRTIRGRIVRDDAEEPGRMIIKLENGRYVLSTECQYSVID